MSLQWMVCDICVMHVHRGSSRGVHGPVSVGAVNEEAGKIQGQQAAREGCEFGEQTSGKHTEDHLNVHTYTQRSRSRGRHAIQRSLGKVFDHQLPRSP